MKQLFLLFVLVIFQSGAQNGWPAWPSWPAQSPSEWPGWPQQGESNTPNEVQAEDGSASRGQVSVNTDTEFAVPSGEEVVVEDQSGSPKSPVAITPQQAFYEDPVFESEDTSVSSCIDTSICFLPMKTGACRAFFAVYYYDPQIDDCTQFVYGGCEGNENRFQTYDQCIQCCKQPQMRKMK